MHADPDADIGIAERIYSPQQFHGGQAGHDGVQVVGNRRAENCENAVAHLAVDNATVLMNGRSHSFQRRREACDGFFECETGYQIRGSVQIGSQDGDIFPLGCKIP
jgi:hypothetical protein